MKIINKPYNFVVKNKSGEVVLSGKSTMPIEEHKELLKSGNTIKIV